jgi:DNA-binding MarR family transcriptional regulator
MAPTRTSPENATSGDLEEVLLLLLQGLMRIVRQEAAAAQLSMPQLLILRWLRRSGPRPATGWAARIGARPSTVSGLIDGLVTAGYARRVHDLVDRRKVLVSLTAAGSRKVDQVESGQRRRIREALVGTTARKRAEAARLLRGLAEQLAADAASVASRSSTGRTLAAPSASEEVAHA